MFPIRDRGSRGALESRRPPPARFAFPCIQTTAFSSHSSSVLLSEDPPAGERMICAVPAKVPGPKSGLL